MFKLNPLNYKVMKLTLLTHDEHCEDIITVNIAHVTMFEKNQLSMTFINDDDQLNLIKSLIKYFVIFECQGKVIKIIPEDRNYQRVRFRFDS